MPTTTEQDERRAFALRDADEAAAFLREIGQARITFEIAEVISNQWGHLEVVQDAMSGLPHVPRPE